MRDCPACGELGQNEEGQPDSWGILCVNSGCRVVRFSVYE